MSGVRVLVGTRKGAFVLTSDGKRERWDVSGPHFGGWEIYHLKGSPVDPAVVVSDAERFLALGVAHVALGDTTGMATPRTVRSMFGQLEGDGLVPIAHFHDTRGTGLVNYVAAYEAGVRHFDCSFGGVGGHPARVKYGGGFTGNVCTEDLVNLFESMGIDTGIDLDGLLATAEFCEQTLGRELHGRVTRSGLSPLLARR